MIDWGKFSHLQFLSVRPRNFVIMHVASNSRIKLGEDTFDLSRFCAEFSIYNSVIFLVGA